MEAGVNFAICFNEYKIQINLKNDSGGCHTLCFPTDIQSAFGSKSQR